MELKLSLAHTLYLVEISTKCGPVVFRNKFCAKCGLQFVGMRARSLRDALGANLAAGHNDIIIVLYIIGSGYTKLRVINCPIARPTGYGIDLQIAGPQVADAVTQIFPFWLPHKCTVYTLLFLTNSLQLLVLSCNVYSGVYIHSLIPLSLPIGSYLFARIKPQIQRNCQPPCPNVLHQLNDHW